MSMYETMIRGQALPTEYYYTFEGQVNNVDGGEAEILLDNKETTLVDLWVGLPLHYKNQKNLKNLIGKRIKIIDAWRFRNEIWLTNKAKILAPNTPKEESQ